MQNITRRKALIAISAGTVVIAAGVGASLFPYEDFVATKLVACDGDSLTHGYGLSERDSYPGQLQHLLGYDYKVINLGVDSQVLDGMIATGAERADNLLDPKWQKRILVAWGGTNDIYFGDGADKAYADYVAYCDTRKAAGWQVVAVTALPRSNGGTPGNFDTSRKAFNESIRHGWSQYASALADVASDERIGDIGDEKDTTYYRVDVVHLNRRGYGIVANILHDAIAKL